MAKPPIPAAAPAPSDDDTDASGAAPGTDAGGGDDDSGDDSGATVLLTVMDNHDGTYTLIEGDEDHGDDDEDMEPGEGDGEGGDDESDSDTGADASDGGDEGEPQGQTFDNPGALLKGILDILKKSEDEGGGSADDNFQAGFAGGADASPPKPALAQKY